eukprot:scaffold654_cov207-Ochromonas_danica.AAC.18
MELITLGAAYQDTRRNILVKEKDYFNLKAKMDILLADQRMLQQENAQKQLEIGNLQDALTSSQSYTTTIQTTNSRSNSSKS